MNTDQVINSINKTLFETTDITGFVVCTQIAFRLQELPKFTHYSSGLPFINEENRKPYKIGVYTLNNKEYDIFVNPVLNFEDETVEYLKH